MGFEDSSLRSENSVQSFAEGLWSSVRKPYDGARQIAGDAVDTPADDASITNKAGQMVGSAALFIGTTALASRLPFLGKVAPMAVGGGLGFLEPIAPGQSWGTRLADAGMGMTAAAALQYGPGMLAKMGMRDTAAQVATSNAGVGMLNTNIDSLLHKGELAGLQDTAMSGTLWAATGVGLHALGAGMRTNQERTAAPATIAREIPMPLGEQPLKPGFWRVDLNDQGVNRMYDLHVPSTYDAARPSRLLLMLDGVSNAKPGQMTFETQFNGRSQADNVVVAYPYAQNNRSIPLAGKVYAWNEQGTGLTPANPQYSDFRFLDNVIADVKSKVNIDPQGITAAGFSEGGMLLHKYAAERPGLLSGFASVHGTMNGREVAMPDASGLVPRQNVMVVHADGDHMLPYKGGRGLLTSLLPQAAESKPFMQAPFWAMVNGSELKPTKVEAPFFTRREWLANDGAHRVTEYVVNGQHAWQGSPAPGLPLVGRPLKADQFSTSDVVWKFLMNATTSRSLDAARV